MLCQSFLKLGLADEMRLSTVPVRSGEGLRLFDNFGTEKRWHLKNEMATKRYCGVMVSALNPLTPSPENGDSSRQETSC